MRKESGMGKTKYAAHSAEFRTEAIRLARDSPVPLARTARELGVNESTLRMWVKAAQTDADPPLDEAERDELRRVWGEGGAVRGGGGHLKKKGGLFFQQHPGGGAGAGGGRAG